MRDAKNRRPEGERSHLAVLGMVVVVLAAVFAAGYYNPVRLGLDLQGGLEVVLKATPTDGERLTSEQLEQSVEVIRDRVDGLGVAEPEIRTQGNDQIVVSLPGVQDPDQAVAVVGSTAQLRFYEWEENVVDNKAFRSAYEALRSAQARATSSIERAEEADEDFVRQLHLFDSEQNLIAGPANTEGRLLEQARDSILIRAEADRPTGWEEIGDADEPTLPEGWQVFDVPVGEILVHGPPEQVEGNGVTLQQGGRFDRTRGAYVLIKDNPGLEGDRIRSATAEAGQGGWVTSMIFDSEGGRRFGEVTEKIARAGALRGNPQRFAIILDNEIKSIPQIDYTQYPTGIKGNQAQISGLDDRAEASNLALVLNTGALPVRFEVISRMQISATLGEQSLRQGLIAGAAGLAIVMLYMIVFYRVLGVVANLALLSFAFIFYGIIVLIPVTMTLPGIAGIILVIGVAADANIIIFERIREEYRAGRSVVQSIRAGYKKGFLTILDATAVTMITATILIVVSVGTVRGFAVLLGIGTLLSIFTAVFFTYALLGTLASVKFFQKPWVIGGSRKYKGTRWKFNWMKRRKRFILGTITTQTAAILIVVFMGLNLGVDFKSGTRFEVTFQQDPGVEQVREALVAVNPGYSNATIQGVRNVIAEEDAGQSFAITVDSLRGGEPTATAANEVEAERERQQFAQRAIEQELDRRFQLVEEPAVQTIGPSFGRQVMQLALIAMVLALILETLYMWWRFDLMFAIPVLFVIMHDLVLSIGFYALTGREFKAATVAALLTIVGYGLYDTVIVFDRIRENMRIMRKSSFRTIVSQSINEVLIRSINTSLTVLLPVLALYFFGGETLRDFAFALAVGIAVSVSASITVGTSILTVLKERDPAWRKRLEAEERAEAEAAAGGSELAPGASAPVLEAPGSGARS
jgi:SecD/SecF fusion protein